MFNLLRPIICNVTRNGTRSASSKVVEVKLPTIDDIPVPSGPWKDHYESRQKVYNAQFMAGVFTLLGTITFVSVSDIIFFNFSPPEEPVEEEN